MRPALMLLAAMGAVILVVWWLRTERPDLAMAMQKRGPDGPPQYVGYVTNIGPLPEPQPAPHIETELERFQRHREVYLNLYPRLGEVLQLDTRAESDLYDLLARQGLDFRGGEESPTEIQDQVAAEKDAAVEKFLGEHKFARFDEYRHMPASREVSRLNQTLGEGHRVRGEAIWRLTQLIHMNSVYGSKDQLAQSSFQTLPPEVAGSPRSQMLISIIRHEDHFRLEERWRSRIATEAASFLTPEQLDALKRSHAETAQGWRRGIEQTRAEVGLPLQMPATPETNYLGIIRRRVPLQSDIRAALTVTVNGEPVRFEHTGANRERFEFQAAKGLRVEAIPTLYDDGSLVMLLAYSETRRGKPRQLDQWSNIECPAGAPHDSVVETRRGLLEYQIQPTGITATVIERR